MQPDGSSVRIPRVVVAGTESGVGKTTVAIGLMAALRRQGLTVQPFKAGPDFIDPGYHTLATGRRSRNLDTWLLGSRTVQRLFQYAAQGSHMAVIEGVMGLFDGSASSHGRGSTAELAKLLQAPVLLVVDARKIARSVAAVVLGFDHFDPGLHLAGVILNRVGGDRHYQILREALGRYTRVPVLGFLPQDEKIALPERHLGLTPAEEWPWKQSARDRLAELVRRSVDIGGVVRISKRAPPLARRKPPWALPKPSARRVRIGLARDRAFHFYYEENLDLLRSLGAELVAFSPLSGRHLPEGLDALYIGGGFPELFAGGLERNAQLRGEIRSAVRAGLPTYAECGGLMYLARGLVDGGGFRHAMVGVLPGMIRMTKRLQNFGYVAVTPKRDNILSRANDRIKGHEFHHSTWDYEVPPRYRAYEVFRHKGPPRTEGLVRKNLLASYIHVHFLTNVRWAEGFIRTAERARESRRSRAGLP